MYECQYSICVTEAIQNPQQDVGGMAMMDQALSPFLCRITLRTLIMSFLPNRLIITIGKFENAV